MWEYLKQLVLDTAGVAAVFTVLGLIFRDALLKYMAGTISSKFAIQIEKAKADLRVKEQKLSQQFSSQEKEIERISEHLSHMRRERDTVLLNKKIEASETILKACFVLRKLTMAVEMLKVLNIKKVSQDLQRDEIAELFSKISEPLKIDEHVEELGGLEITTAKLYLSERAFACYEAYQLVMSHAALALKTLSVGWDVERIFSKDALRKTVESLAPESKTGFDKYGEIYSYYWVDWLYEETVKSLRADIHGTNQNQYDFSSATETAIASKQAYVDVMKVAKDAGLSDDLIIKDEHAPAPVRTDTTTYP